MRLAITTITTIALIFALVMELGGCSARYRYPCQDPANWGREECHNEACKADGSCTENTLGSLYRPEDIESQQLIDDAAPSPPPDDVSPESEPRDNSHPEQNEPEPNAKLSSNTCPPVDKPDKAVNFRGKAMPPPPLPAVESQTEAEQPLTMDTVVDTAEHNIAAR